MELESGYRLSKKYRQFVDVYLRDHVGKDVFYLPSVEELCNYIGGTASGEDLQAQLIRIYDDMFGAEKKFDLVEDDIKILQIFMLDGPVYGFNTETGEMKLYTAADMLGDISTFDLGKTVTNNIEGIVHAMRLDVKYLDLSGNYEVKPVRLTVKNNLKKDQFIFIPGYVVKRLCSMLKELMNGGRVVQIAHNMDGAGYKRHVSLNKSVLEDYNGGDRISDQIRMIDFRYTGRLYLPVVGAPLSSAGITKIDFKDIDQIKILDRRQANEIKQADNSIESLIRSEVFGKFVEQVFSVEDEKYKKDLWDYLDEGSGKLPYNSSKYEYLRAIRDLSPQDSSDLFEVLGEGAKGIAQSLGNLFTEVTPIAVPESMWELKNLLREGVYRIVTMRQSGSFYSIYATDNDDILEMVYGDDYVERFEVDGKKLDLLRSRWDNNLSVKENARLAGLDYPELDDEGVKAKLNEIEAKQEERMSGGYGGGGSTPKSGSVRVLFNPETSRSYYRQINLDKVYSVTRMS